MAMKVLAEAGDDRDSSRTQILMVEGPTTLQIHEIHAAAIDKRPSPTRINADRRSIKIPLIRVTGVVRRVERRRFRQWLHISQFDPWPGNDLTADGFWVHSRGAHDRQIGQEARVGVLAKGGEIRTEGKVGVFLKEPLPALALSTEQGVGAAQRLEFLGDRGQLQHDPPLKISREIRGYGLSAF
jgi:hypothetical protein